MKHGALLLLSTLMFCASPVAAQDIGPHPCDGRGDYIGVAAPEVIPVFQTFTAIGRRTKRDLKLMHAFTERVNLGLHIIETY